MAYKNFYFKHFNNASQGATLSTLLANKDYEAYAAFWVLLELVSRFEDPNNPDARGQITISWERYGREIGWKPSKSRRVLFRIASVSKIEINEKKDGNVSFLVPNWLEFQETRGGKREAKEEQKNGKTSAILEERNKKEENRNKNDFAAIVSDPDFKVSKQIEPYQLAMLEQTYPSEFLAREFGLIKADLFAREKSLPKSTSHWYRLICSHLKREWLKEPSKSLQAVPVWGEEAKKL